MQVSCIYLFANDYISIKQHFQFINWHCCWFLVEGPARGTNCLLFTVLLLFVVKKVFWEWKVNCSVFILFIRENVTTTEATRDSVQKIGDIMHRNMRQIKVTIFCSFFPCDVI